MRHPIYTTLAESKVIEVIHTRVAVGEVRPGDSPRAVHLYHALDGTLLAYFDPYLGPLDMDIQSGVLRMYRKSAKVDLDALDVAYPKGADKARSE
ncbi:hypothetical protein [Burkholderia plantarii]|uniref:hypothetical protein n=1 Tax=Burkholderia plantarii TaxID=41899 RepID=UPI00114CB6B0|nr:hypothetical protein [Burkholderia plantarii]